MTRSILLAATLAVSTAAAPTVFAVERGIAVSPAVSPDRAGDEDVASMRRTLMSVLVLQKLQLSPAQKHDLQGVLSDMKQLRDERKSDKTLQSIGDQRKALLQKAIDEARAKGEVSPETKDAILALRDQTRDAMKPFAGRGRDVMKRLKGILTTDQIESLKDLRGEVGPLFGEGGARPEAGTQPEGAQPQVQPQGRPAWRGGEGAGRGMLLRLLMSDEFQAELAK